MWEKINIQIVSIQTQVRSGVYVLTASIITVGVFVIGIANYLVNLSAGLWQIPMIAGTAITLNRRRKIELWIV